MTRRPRNPRAGAKGRSNRRRESAPPPRSAPEKRDSQERLQKTLAQAGLGSRRKCEELIGAGRVEVDRQVVTELGTKVDPTRQEIRVDGEPLARRQKTYYALHKPRGVVSTARDPAGRPRVVDLVPDDRRVFPVGRLDLHSEGLILLTNDGDLTNTLTHPRYGVEKTYHVLVVGPVERDELRDLRRGMRLAEGFAQVKRLRVKSRERNNTWLEMVLAEGRNREIRRLLARVGHKVLRLRRVAVGPVRLGELPEGAYRPLTGEEVRDLRKLAGERRSGERRAEGGERRAKGGEQGAESGEQRGRGAQRPDKRRGRKPRGPSQSRPPR